MAGIVGCSACWVKGCQTGDVAWSFGAFQKIVASKAAAKAARSVSASSGCETRQAAEPARAAHLDDDRRSASAFASPMKATPSSGMPRRVGSPRSTARLWLMVPSAVRAHRIERQRPSARTDRCAGHRARQRHHQPARAFDHQRRRPLREAPARSIDRDRRRARRRDAARRASSGDRLRAGSARASSPDSRRTVVAVGLALESGLHRLPVEPSSAPASAAANTVLPMPVSVPVTTKRRHAPRLLISAAESREQVARSRPRRALQRQRERSRAVPSGTVGGRMARMS